MKHSWLIPAVFVFGLSVSSTAAASSEHYLLARAATFSGPPNTTQFVALPDLSGSAHATYVDSSGTGSVHNEATVNSDLGQLSVSTTFGQAAGGTLNPNDWDIVALIEEAVYPASSNKTGLKLRLAWSGGGTLTGASQGWLKASAFLRVNANCQGSFHMTKSADGTVTPDSAMQGCSLPGYAAIATTSGVDIDIEDIGTGVAIEAQLRIDYDTVSAVVGNASANLTGTLTMTSVGGGVFAKSPTFLGGSANPPGGDAGTNPGVDSGSPNNGNDAGGSPNPNGQDAQAPSGSDGGSPPPQDRGDDGGCNVGGGGAAGSWLAGLTLGALMLLARARGGGRSATSRARRARAARS